jgi:hypothetical protein
MNISHPFSKGGIIIFVIFQLSTKTLTVGGEGQHKNIYKDEAKVINYMQNGSGLYFVLHFNEYIN